MDSAKNDTVGQSQHNYAHVERKVREKQQSSRYWSSVGRREGDTTYKSQKKFLKKIVAYKWCFEGEYSLEKHYL